MALNQVDQRELIYPLLEGLFSVSPWDEFLQRLLPRTGADRVHLFVEDGARTSMQRRIVARGWAGKDCGDELAVLRGPSRRLRPNRPYALDEMLMMDSGEERAELDAALKHARIGDARLIRIGIGADPVLMVLLSERKIFGGADSALLTALAPVIELAAAKLDEIETLRLRAAAAEETLGLLGIAQAVMNRHGKLISTDELWRSRQPPVTAQVWEQAAAPGTRTLSMVDDVDLLYRPMSNSFATVVNFRVDRREALTSAARTLAAIFGLSQREAMLAALLSQGKSLVEAGHWLRLTEGTARNYSKRIYAKTGAQGQADLVRMVMSSLAVLS